MSADSETCPSPSCLDPRSPYSCRIHHMMQPYSAGRYDHIMPVPNSEAPRFPLRSHLLPLRPPSWEIAHSDIHILYHRYHLLDTQHNVRTSVYQVYLPPRSRLRFLSQGAAQGRRPRCRWWNRTAHVFASKVRPIDHRPVSVRYSWCSRSCSRYQSRQHKQCGQGLRICRASVLHDRTDLSIKDALTGAEIVIIPAGVPRKPGMTRDDLFVSVSL
jgi:hypothetical protein